MYQQRKNREKIYCTAEYWNMKAAIYLGDAVSMWPNNYLNYYYHQEHIALLDRYLPELKGSKVLDIGCGPGRISRYLASRGAIVLGIDFSANAIAIAKKQTSDNNPSYREQSLFDLRDRDEFDALVSRSVLTLACRNRDDLLNVMMRLSRSLKSGGNALFIEPVHSGFLHRTLNLGLKDFCEVMSEAGFIVKSIEQMHFWPARLALGYVTWPKFVTTAGYHLGQFIMHNLCFKNEGDYKAIFAVKK